MRAITLTVLVPAVGAALLSVGSSRALGASSCSSGGGLKYYGGPVLQNPKVYAAMWSSNVSASVATTLPAFYQAIVQSPYVDWLSEYNTVALNGQDGQPGSNQGISRGTFGGTFTLVPSMCAGTTACTVTDAQIQSELASQITAGHLPAPTVGCDGQNDTLYMIHFPANVTETTAGGASCQFFCYSHGVGTYAGKTFAYGVFPDVTTGPCLSVCGPSTQQPINNQTAWASYGLVAAVTDPEVSLVSSAGRPLGWYSANCGEIADLCSGQQGTLTIGTTTWTVAPAWSNVANDCVVSRATLPPICTGAGTPTGCRSCSCADDRQGGTGQVGCAAAAPVCDLTATDQTYHQCVAAAVDAGAVGAGGAAGGAGAGGGGGGAAGGGAGGHAQGTEGGSCYGNGTCNAGLVCLSQLCVRPPDGGLGTSGGGGGCGCRVSSGSGTIAGPLVLGLLALLSRRRMRAPASRR